ncbi:MAG: helix-turn-helix domain-containing protein [Myxococcota bacterium]
MLDSARRLFGERGYADTSLEEIARDCALTIAPIYHYFGSKRGLFEAVVEAMNARILATLDESASAPWRSFLDLCLDPGFRRIVLVDAPTVLGRAHWTESPVYGAASRLLGHDDPNDLEARMLLGALAEAALTIAESEDPQALSEESERAVARLLRAFRR